jgi:hypothetical protein
MTRFHAGRVLLSAEPVGSKRAYAFRRWCRRQCRATGRFDSWEQLFEQMARMLGDSPAILIFDEFPYTVESDPSLPSHLQAAWDHLLKRATWCSSSLAHISA